MKTASFVVLSILAVALLSGCASQADKTPNVVDKPILEANKGGIQGLLIDDVYRPIPGGRIFLTPLGLTATADTLGQFQFLDLDPGTYTLKAAADGHEAAPVVVDVVAKQFAEIEVSARRVTSEGSRTVTLQYSVFIPCAASASLVSTVHGYCFYDGSGDSYRPGLGGLDFQQYNNQSLTYFVGEYKVNQPDYYVLVVREDNGGSFGGEEYARALTSGGDYSKFILQRGANYMETDNSAVWNNTKRMEVILFYYGPGGEEVSGTVTPTYCNSPAPTVPNPSSGRPLVGCREYYGVGHKMGIKANIILTLFLGEPDQSIDDYGVLG